MSLRLIEPASSLRLQQMLYYNVLYSAVHVVYVVGLIVWKLNSIEMNVIMQFIVPIFSGVWVLIEPVRLLLGISGNMRERVPELAAFLLLTVFPQLPVTVLLGFLAADRMPMDIIAAAPQLVFVVLEAVVAYSTVRSLMQKQTAEFFRECAEQDDDDNAAALPPGSVAHGGPPSTGDIVAAGVTGLTGLARTTTPDSGRGEKSD